jgi:hypothetical protein
MKIDHCQEATNRRKIVVAERGKKATFVNDAQNDYICTRYDGCVPAMGLKADYILSRPKMGCVVIELKGKNVEHAIKQVMQTADFWVQRGFCCGRIAGLIVSVGIPASSTTLQRAKIAFAKRFKGGRLSVVSGNREVEFEAVLL